MLRKILNRFFPHPQIPLHHTSAFTLLIAVMLSAQCTDKRVNLVTPHLPKTPKALAALSLREIEAIIKSCGFYHNKARALKETARIIAEEGMPRTLEGLEKLPGVGHKTASVVMVQAYGKPAFPVDTHIFRLAHRWGLSKGKTVKAVEEDLKKIFPKRSWGKVHLQMIEAGRTYCTARGHKDCPICKALKS